MTSQVLTQRIVLKLIKFKWLVLLLGIAGAVLLFFYAKTIEPVYTARATVFPLTAAIENQTASAIGNLLGGAEAPSSFSREASINIVELAESRDTRDAVVLKRLPEFANKSIAQLLIESYNNTKASYTDPIEVPEDSLDLAATGSDLLKASYTAKILKSGILEITFSNTNKKILSPVSYALIDKISQFYIDLKIRKAKSDFDFTVKKIDSLQDILSIYDRRAIVMNNSTMFVPNSKIEYSIPKENLVTAKERVVRQRDAAANNREEALWRLQKARPIIAILDKPTPPFSSKKPSLITYTASGFFIGILLMTLILIAPLFMSYMKVEANKMIFPEPVVNDEPTVSPH